MPDISKMGPEMLKNILSKVTEMAGEGGKNIGDIAGMIQKMAQSAMG